MTIAASDLAPVASWPALRELRDDVSQRVFHQIMEAFSFPGQVRRIPSEAVTSPVPPVIAPLLALADLMAPVAALGCGEEASAVAAVSRLTGAPVADPSEARFALALSEPDDISRLNRGSHWSPERGAMLVQRVAAIEAGSAGWRLTGPGIKPGEPTEVRVAGMSDGWAAQRAELTSDYPAGVDCLLVADDGSFIALSRTTVVEVI